LLGFFVFFRIKSAFFPFLVKNCLILKLSVILSFDGGIHEKTMSTSQTTQSVADNFNNNNTATDSPTPHDSIPSESCDEEAGEADNENSSGSVMSINKNQIELDSLLNTEKRYTFNLKTSNSANYLYFHLFILFRPMIASPFMPQITRQISVTNPTAATAQVRRHRQRSQSPGNCNVNVAAVSTHPRYGSLAQASSIASDRRQHVTKLGTIPATQDSDEEEEALERRPTLKLQPSEDDTSSSSSSDVTRFSDLTRKEVSAFLVCLFLTFLSF
jgi:hypothetical protein